MLTLIGLAASRATGLLPWAGPKAILALLYACLAVMAIGGPAGGVWLHMRGQMSVMEAKINAEWTAKLALAENEYVSMANEAILAASLLEPVASNADVVRMCEQSPACRDRRNATR